MSDLDLKTLCALAMGIRVCFEGNTVYIDAAPELQAAIDALPPYDPEAEEGVVHRLDLKSLRTGHIYDPLTNDAQAMELVRRFNVELHPPGRGIRGDDYRREWYGLLRPEGERFGPAWHGHHESLNRTICECVAKMQRAKQAEAA